MSNLHLTDLECAVHGWENGDFEAVIEDGFLKFSKVGGARAFTFMLAKLPRVLEDETADEYVERVFEDYS